MAGKSDGSRRDGAGTRTVVKSSRRSSKKNNSRMQAELLFWFRRAESASERRGRQADHGLRPDEGGVISLFSCGRPHHPVH